MPVIAKGGSVQSQVTPSPRGLMMTLKFPKVGIKAMAVTASQVSKLLSPFRLIIFFVLLLAVRTHESQCMLWKSIPFTPFRQARHGPQPLVIAVVVPVGQQSGSIFFLHKLFLNFSETSV